MPTAAVVLAALTTLSGCSDDASNSDGTRATSPVSSPTVPPECLDRMSAYFELGTSDAAVHNVEQMLLDRADVEQVRTFDQAAALAEAERIFRDDPETLELIEASRPAGFIYVVVSTPGSLDAVESALSAAPGVSHIIRPGDFLAGRKDMSYEEMQSWCHLDV